MGHRATLLVAALCLFQHLERSESFNAPISRVRQGNLYFSTNAATTTTTTTTTRNSSCRRNHGQCWRQWPRSTLHHPYYMSSSSSVDTSSSSWPLDSSLSTDNVASQRTQEKTTSSAVPTYRKMLVFIGTTILIWLSEPLLSLVDTTVVGRSSAATKKALVELAALGPATMLIDSGIYLTYFLAIATTNVMAKALAEGNLQALQQHASHVLGVAAVLGLVVMCVVFGLGKPLLTSWTAGALASKELVQAAFSYCKIRSVVAPLVIMDLVSQSICLACLDTTTPALAVAVASIVNIVGDVLLVTKFRMGIQGAAIATAVASVSSSLVLLSQIKRKTIKWKQRQEEEDAKQQSQLNNDETVPLSYEATEGDNDSGDNSVESDLGIPANDDQMSKRGVAENEQLHAKSSNGMNGSTHQNTRTSQKMATITHDELSLQPSEKFKDTIPFVSLPDKMSLFNLIKLGGPIFFVMCGKVICYSAMTLRATDFGVWTLACHNVMMRIFFFLATFGDALSQAAQSFLPQVLYQKPTTHKNDMQRLLRRLFVMSTLVGVVNSQVAGWILRKCGSYFTKDPTIITLMSQHTRYLGLGLLLHPFIMLFEGSLVATRDLMYLVGTYVVTMALLMAQLNFGVKDFMGVWIALFVFQILRLVQFSARFFHKTVQNHQETSE